MSGSSPETGGYVATNVTYPGGPHDAHTTIYGYIPSFSLSIFAIIFFTLSFVVHAFKGHVYRTTYFLPLSLGCAIETLGYIFRALSSQKDPYSIIYFVVQYFMIVTAPVLTSASIYVCLSRLITWAVNEGFDLSASRGPVRWIKPKVLLWSFISCDVISTSIQIFGAAWVGKKESDHKVRKTYFSRDRFNADIMSCLSRLRNIPCPAQRDHPHQLPLLDKPSKGTCTIEIRANMYVPEGTVP